MSNTKTKITKDEVVNSLQRIGAVALGAIVIFALFYFVTDEVTNTHQQLAPMYEIVTDTTQKYSAEYQEKVLKTIVELEGENSRLSIWQNLGQAGLAIVLFTVLANLVIFAFTQIRWSRNEDETAMVKAAKVKAVSIIYASVNITGALIILGNNLL